MPGAAEPLRCLADRSDQRHDDLEAQATVPPEAVGDGDMQHEHLLDRHPQEHDHAGERQPGRRAGQREQALRVGAASDGDVKPGGVIDDDRRTVSVDDVGDAALGFMLSRVEVHEPLERAAMRGVERGAEDKRGHGLGIAATKVCARGRDERRRARSTERAASGLPARL